METLSKAKPASGKLIKTEVSTKKVENGFIVTCRYQRQTKGNEYGGWEEKIYIAETEADVKMIVNKSLGDLKAGMMY